MVPFSARVPASLVPNAVTRALGRARTGGRRLLDLTEANPTRAGLPYPPDLLDALASPLGLAYAPDPLGLRSAREAVAEALGHARGGAAPSPDRLALTASTSEAYAVLFKLLCDAGDEVLVPQPSYPLFEHLAALDNVAARPYALDPHGHWCLDRESLAAAASPRTRIVVVVSPNNPTGSMIHEDDWAWLTAWCAARDVAVIVDEVFAWYPLAVRPGAACPVLASGSPPALVFALDGLSKSCGLPQVKLGWMEVDGPARLVEPALRRLELILDTYLSVSTPVQVALPGLLRGGALVREAIRERLRRNLETARATAAVSGACSLHEPEGGWSAVWRVPATRPEEGLVLDALEHDGVLVHPGYFFDFPREAFLVVSLLPRPDEFGEGVSRVLARAMA